MVASSMPEHDPTAYGSAIADRYDALYGDREPEATIEAVVGLAQGGPVLELGIGTGRVALPLRERGLRVAGIEGSPEMVERLRAKPGGREIEVAVGDFASTMLAARDFGLVLLNLNTIFALPDQDAQVRCFANAAAHLRPGGRFVVEAMVLEPALHREGVAVAPRTFGEGHVELQASRYDAAAQRITRRLVLLGAGGVQVVSVEDRYAWPGELDLMARMGGLALEHRWGAWEGTPFTSRSDRHVSVYRR